MNKAQLKIEKSIELYKKLKNVEWLDSEVSGEINLDNEVLELINLLDQEALIYPTVVVDGKALTLSELSNKKHFNKIIKIKIQPPRSPSGEPYFAKDINDLLSIKKFKIKEPSVYYVADHDYYNLKSEPDDSIRKYLSIIKLISIIQNISDHNEVNGDKSKSIILTKGKLVIPIHYSHDDLCSFNNIEELLIELSTSPHINNKIEILRSTLFESLINIPEGERFHFLLKSFDSLYHRFKDNFNLFMSEFSLDRIKEEVSERKVEYIHNLNKVVSDIQNKILAIPVALLLVSTQMSPSKDDIIKNFVILIGSYVFLLLMNFLINNQLNTLESIKDSIQHTQENYLTKYASFYNKFEGVFQSLFQRYNRQKTILKIIWYIVLLSFLISLAMFIIFMKEVLF